MTQGRKTTLILLLTPEERYALKPWQRSTTIRAGLGKRARIILMLADDASITHMTKTVGIRHSFVFKWAERYRRQGLTGLANKAIPPFEYRSGEFLKYFDYELTYDGFAKPPGRP